MAQNRSFGNFHYTNFSLYRYKYRLAQNIRNKILTIFFFKKEKKKKKKILSISFLKQGNWTYLNLPVVGPEHEHQAYCVRPNSNLSQFSKSRYCIFLFHFFIFYGSIKAQNLMRRQKSDSSKASPRKLRSPCNINASTLFICMSP